MSEKKKAAYSDPNNVCKGTDIFSSAQGNGDVFHQVLAETVGDVFTADSLPMELDALAETLRADDTPLSRSFRLIDDDTDMPPVTHLVKFDGVGVFEENRLSGVISVGHGNKTGGGKSSFSAIIAATVMSGRISPCICEHPGTVCYCDAEMGASRVKQFRQRGKAIIGHSGGVYNPRQLVTLTFNEQQDASNADRMTAIVELMRMVSPRLVVLDPLCYFIEESSKSLDGEIKSQIADIKRAAAANNATVLLVCHGTKSGDNEDVDGRIGTLVQRDLTDLIAVERDGNGYEEFFEVRSVKHRGVAFQPFRFSFMGRGDEAYPYPYSIPENQKSGISDDTLKSYVDAVFGNEKELASGVIISRLKDLGNFKDTKAKGYMKQFKEKGYIKFTQFDGRYALYRIETK